MFKPEHTLRLCVGSENSNRIKLYSPSGTSAANIKRELEPAVGIAIDVAKSAEETVRNSDLVVTATTAQQPILKCEWLKPGAHINAVGSHRPDSREIDGPTVAQSKVVVDSREAIMAECGDILLAIKEKSITENHLHAEIGEVLAGTNRGEAAPVKSPYTNPSASPYKTSLRHSWSITRHWSSRSARMWKFSRAIR